jgi:hypothetical protein
MKSPSPPEYLEVLEALERAFDILDGIADKLLYEDGEPVTFLEPRDIDEIYSEAISELAPISEILTKARRATP